jgi:hypothetical protein
MTTSITIDRRFNGPVASGNGGYSAGLAARLIEGAAEVTLRAPVPLDELLSLVDTPSGIDVLDGETLVMSVKPATLQAPLMRPPSLAAAVRATHSYPSVEDHVLPTCFVCGPSRPDGLRLFTGLVEQADNPNAQPIVASPWIPAADLADESGRIAPEYIWAAIDCPGAFALDVEPILLGRISAAIIERPRPGDQLIVVAWARGSDRRKHFAGVGLYSEAGALLAHAEQTWIQIDQHAHLKG